MADFKKSFSGFSFEVEGGRASIEADHALAFLDVEEVLALAEFAAAAYEALEGKPYEHKEYREALTWTVEAGEAVTPRSQIVGAPGLAIQMMSDPGPGTTSYGEPYTIPYNLERDCE